MSNRPDRRLRPTSSRGSADLCRRRDVPIFNQSTDNLLSGYFYTYRIPLSDGPSIYYTFGIR